MAHQLHVNGRFLCEPRPTGTQRSSTHLLQALRESLAATGREHLLTVRKPGGSGRGALAHLWEQFWFPLLVRRGIGIHFQGTAPALLPTRRQVMFVHDLNYELLPEAFSPAFRRWYRFACGVAARRSDLIFCFTRFVKATIQELLGVPEERIRVIPPGPGIRITGAPPPPPEPVRYLLCVGSLQPHKNLERIVQAWRRLLDSGMRVRLVVVGRRQDRFAPMSLPGGDEGRERAHPEFTGYIDDHALEQLYRGAAGFVFPSLIEGCGLPVIEAFHLGCPVVTSNCSSLPEVAGDAALTVDPRSVDELADAMRRLVEDEGLRRHLRERGLERARDFTWDRAGRAMVEALDELARADVE